MMAKLLLDQNIPRSAADELRRRGFDVAHTGDVGMARARDVEILDFADRECRVVVTFDADFHSLMAARRTTRPSVVRIRTAGLSGRDVADLIQDVCSKHADEIAQGCLITIREGRSRVRNLPLSPPS